MHKATQKIVIIGGGTGTYVVGSGLKKYPVDLTAIVTVADSGGSTGRLRDEFGFLPVGDLRQALAAFAQEDEKAWIRQLLLYRFEKGSGLEGHNLGNLILTALQDMTKSTAKAIEIASQIFALVGHIYPSTTTNIQLVTEFEDGSIVIGEHMLDDSPHAGKRIVSLKTSPRARIYSKAKHAIIEADVIVIGPGDVYGSIAPNLIIEGSKRAFSKTSAKIVYVLNLMTRHAQTHGLTAKDHLRIIEAYIGKPVDHVIANSKTIPEDILKKYASQHEYPVKLDLKDSRIIKKPLIATTYTKTSAKDTVSRSFLRHDPKILGQVLYELVGR
jgi:uncharacterized cofD-like protein